MAEKVTTMVLKVVDLQCCRCYKKVKKVLCKFPQIRDQIYEVKTNTVTITVVCCNPEKIRDKICYRGGGSIKSIEIKPPPPSPRPPPTGPSPPEPPPPRPPPPGPPPPKPPPPGPPPPRPPPPGPPPRPPHPGSPPSRPPQPGPPPVGFCCRECYHGNGGGPCHFGRPPCYGSCGRPFCHCCGCWACGCWGCGRCYNHCYCFCEENPQVCSIM